jgi:pimeloyl-ACP methyl ester carboxylesterase
VTGLSPPRIPRTGPRQIQPCRIRPGQIRPRRAKPRQIRPRQAQPRRAAALGALAAVAIAAMLAACSSSPPATRPPAAATPANTAPAASPTAASPASIAQAPVRVAQTSDGAVGYREVGSGPPLVLISGFGATIDDWAPGFVDALAGGHRVVVPDNAGVGKTAALPGPLTISALADQVSALMSALHLGRSDVLGWSMGGMTAQALAVRHPAQVGALVLAATQPGNGHSLPVPKAAAAALTSTNPAVVLSVLFPASQRAAEALYVEGILQYPDREQVAASVAAQQGHAISAWLGGTDPAGRATAHLRVRTLVADGTADALDPVANDRQLAALIPGAQLVLYPGAGHAFLFQDQSAFVPRLEQFLG